LRARAAQVAADFESAAARQHDIEQHQIKSLGACAAAGRLAVGDDFDLVALRSEVVLERHGDGRLVFNNQDACHCSSFLSGSSTVKVLPTPEALSRRISPPCAATM